MSTQHHLGDPTWYRLSYSIAAQSLDRVDLPRPDAERALDAEMQARALLDVIRRQLHGAGWTEVGRRPGWFTRWRLRSRKGTEIRDERVADFLDQTVEPATVALLWSARVARGDSLGFLHDALPRPIRGDRIKRPSRSDADADERRAEAYLLQLLATGPRDSRLRRALSRIGLMQRPARTVSPRVHYTLCCLLARDIRQLDRPDEYSSALAFDQLAMCFRYLKGSPRDTLARWAWADPALAVLRPQTEDCAGTPPSLTLSTFAQIVGPAGEPVEVDPEPDPGAAGPAGEPEAAESGAKPPRRRRRHNI